MIALVTGGAHGIGAAVVRLLAERGDDVVVADIDPDGEQGSLFVRTDVRDLVDNERAVAATVEEFGGLDAVVFSAGVAGRCGLEDFSVARYRDTMSVNLDAVVYGLAACTTVLRGGSALVVSSIAGLTGSPDAFYAASKHALIGLARSVTPGFRVNALCPGLVDTRAVAPFRSKLVRAGLALAAPAEVAVAARTVLDDERTNQVWVVQAGRPAEPVPATAPVR